MSVTMKATRLNLRIDERSDQLIRDAAGTAGVSVSAFVERAALNEAQRQLADQTVFELEPERWDAFVAELDRPPRELPELDRAIDAYRGRHGRR